MPDGAPSEFDDRPREACGVMGIYAPGSDVARLTFFGQYALQHRGQESAGIVTCDGASAYVHKGLGLVSQVFNEASLRPLKGGIAVGHNRYSTCGSSHPRNVQPYLIETIHGPLALAHNGNLTNAPRLRRLLLERGVGLSTSTDSEIILQMLAAPPEVWEPDQAHSTTFGLDRWQARVRAFMQLAEGAYSLTLLTREALYGVRDPLGLRPLCLGQLDAGGWVLASESCALSTIGARLVREVDPGEIIRLDKCGAFSTQGVDQLPARALCSFEHVYFARPDSMLDGEAMHQVRQRMGRELAREAPADADIVVPVPDSAIPAAIGYSLESGIPFGEGLIKNRYIGRTFIQPDDQLRRVGIALKFNPLAANLAGKRIVLVDDSIVRGNTAGPLVQLMRMAGATEVHVRVSSPPVRHPCFMGVDLASRRELIAHRMTVAETCTHIGADSLMYVSLEGMTRAIGGQAGGELASPDRSLCAACFSGAYPLRVPEWLMRDDRGKLAFERQDADGDEVGGEA